MNKSTDGGASVGSRLDWIDIAKGFCIILVVLMHTSLGMANFAPGKSVIWLQLSEFFAPVRMPLFFMISGMLASSSLSKSFSTNSARIIGLYLIYAFWTALFLSRVLIPAARGGMPVPDIGDFGLSLLLPTSYWYIWALPVFHLVCWAMYRRIPGFSWVIFGLLSLLSITFVEIDRQTARFLVDPLDALKLGACASNFIWFYVGTHGKPLIARLVYGATARKAALAMTIYVIIFAVAKIMGLNAALGAKFFLTPIALLLATQVIGLINPATRLAGTMASIGRLTLPVYIFHIFGISILSAAVKLSGLLPFVTAHLKIVDLIMTPVVAAVLIICSRFIGKIIIRSPFRHLLIPKKFTFGSGGQLAVAAATE